MSNFVIRNAIESDLEFIVRSNDAVCDVSCLERPDNHELKERLQNAFFENTPPRSDAWILIAEIDGVPVGMIVYSSVYFPMKEGECLWISNIYVDSEHRGTGVAEKLMNRVKEIAIKENYDSICFLEDVANEPAKKVANKIGAQEYDNLRFFFVEVRDL